MKTVCLQSLKYIGAESLYKLDTDENIYLVFLTPLLTEQHNYGKQDQEVT